MYSPLTYYTPVLKEVILNDIPLIYLLWFFSYYLFYLWNHFIIFVFNLYNKVMKNRSTITTTVSPKLNALTNNQMAMSEGVQEDSQRLESIPFKNSAISVFDKLRYDISRDFDGQEVKGSLSVRPTITGGRVETERFDIPGSGTNMSRTRFNDQGQPTRRVVKDKKINK